MSFHMRKLVQYQYSILLTWYKVHNECTAVPILYCHLTTQCLLVATIEEEIGGGKIWQGQKLSGREERKKPRIDFGLDWTSYMARKARYQTLVGNAIQVLPRSKNNKYQQQSRK